MLPNNPSRAAGPPASLASIGLSYSHGPSDVSLIGETIGENLRRIVERYADHDALVVRHQAYRATYRELWQQVDAAARAFMAHGVRKGDRVGIWAANRAEWVVTQLATARIGAILVTVNPAYRAAELSTRSPRPASACWCWPAVCAGRTTARCSPRCAARCPDLREAIVIDDDWDGFVADGHEVSDEQLAEREAGLQFDDPINIQFTSGTTGLPEGRDAVAPQHPQQRPLRRVARWPTERGPRLRPGALLPLLRDGARQSRLVAHGACVVVPSESFDPQRCSRPWKPSAARPSTACRRCSSPSSRRRISTAST